MANIQVVAVSKIIEGALNGDLEKVIAYGNHIADGLEKQGEQRATRIIRNAVNNVKSENIVVLD